MAPVLKPRGSVFNPRTVTAPIAAILMAGILYTYSVTSIRAAKRNAQLHREADGGQLDMRRESLRRHGVLAKVEGTKDMDLFRNANADAQKEKTVRQFGERQREDAGTARTVVEGTIEEYKGKDGQRKLAEGGLLKPVHDGNG